MRRKSARLGLLRSTTAGVVAVSGLLAGCGGSSTAAPEATSSAETTGSSTTTSNGSGSSGSGGGGAGAITFKGDAWADNWFSLARNGELVAEDSVPITTVKSFNSESFTFEASYPFTLAFVLKDYVENDTGLEYIGTPNQKMGDAGFAFQLREEATGKLILVSDAAWRCDVVFRAPLDKSCEKAANPSSACTFTKEPEPTGWQLPNFDDASWEHATEHSASAVGPKEGYNDVTWDPSVKFIWSADLFSDNTVLCRTTVTAP